MRIKELVPVFALMTAAACNQEKQPPDLSKFKFVQKPVITDVGPMTACLAKSEAIEGYHVTRSATLIDFPQGERDLIMMSHMLHKEGVRSTVDQTVYDFGPKSSVDINPTKAMEALGFYCGGGNPPDEAALKEIAPNGSTNELPELLKAPAPGL